MKIIAIGATVSTNKKYARVVSTVPRTGKVIKGPSPEGAWKVHFEGMAKSIDVHESFLDAVKTKGK